MRNGAAFQPRARKEPPITSTRDSNVFAPLSSASMPAARKACAAWGEMTANMGALQNSFAASTGAAQATSIEPNRRLKINSQYVIRCSECIDPDGEPPPHRVTWAKIRSPIPEPAPSSSATVIEHVEFTPKRPAIGPATPTIGRGPWLFGELGPAGTLDSPRDKRFLPTGETGWPFSTRRAENAKQVVLNQNPILAAELQQFGSRAHDAKY